MAIKDRITGVQHLGLPTRDFEGTLKFYEGLGFEVEWRSAEFPVAFIRNGSIEMETFQKDEANQVWGAWDHIAIDVDDVDKTWADAKEAGYKIVEGEDGPILLPFFEKGVRYFTIEGPNKEKIEFNQKL